MLKTMFAAALSAAVLGFAGHASAQSFSIRTNLTVSQTITRVCDVTLNGTLTPGGVTGLVTSATFAAGQVGCGFPIAPRNLPWAVTYYGADTFQITGVGINSILGYCDEGTLYLSGFSGGISAIAPFPGAVTFSGVPPVSYPLATCNVFGSFSVIWGP